MGSLSFADGIVEVGPCRWRAMVLQFFCPALQTCMTIERAMAKRVPSRSVPRLLRNSPSGPKFRWRLGNSSTKVLFRHPDTASTFVPHAAAPASILLATGSQLSLRVRIP